MRILYHHRTASKDGQAVHIEELIDALRGLGHEVLVVAPGKDHASRADSQEMGAKVEWVHGLRGRLPKWAYELLELGYSWVAYLRLMRAARAFRPDAIYERHNLFLLSGSMVSRRLHLPLLLEVNSPLTDERLKFGGLGLPRLARWSERKAWRTADGVLPVTQVLAEILVAEGVPRDRITVIPNGINEAAFANAPTPEAAKRSLGWDDSLVLGFTGFVREWHRVDRALRWMASPDAPPRSRLLVVGDGPARTDLETLASALGLADRVRITGFVDRSSVAAWAAAFDIALQPAVTPYASPLKLFEYMALGKAVLAPRARNIEEVLAHEQNALLFDDEDELQFARGLTRLSQDARLRVALGTAARQTIVERGLTWNANARRVVELFAALQEERRRPSTTLKRARMP